VNPTDGKDEEEGTKEVEGKTDLHFCSPSLSLSLPPPTSNLLSSNIQTEQYACPEVVAGWIGTTSESLGRSYAKVVLSLASSNGFKPLA